MGLKQIYEFTEESTFSGDLNVLVQSTVADSTNYRQSLNTIKAGINAASVNIVSTNYTVTDADNIDRVECDTTSNDCLVMLPTFTDNYGRVLEVFHLLDASNDVIVQGEEANKLSADAMNQIYLPKESDRIKLWASSYSSYWEVLDERISCQLRVDGFKGWGNTDTEIMQFETKETGFGNAFSENHTSGYNSTEEGLEITIAKSGKYAFVIANQCPGGGGTGTGLSLNSAQLGTDIGSINIGDRLSVDSDSAAGYVMTASWTGYLTKSDIVRAHGEGSNPASTFVSHFTATYLGA